MTAVPPTPIVLTVAEEALFSKVKIFTRGLPNWWETNEEVIVSGKAAAELTASLLDRGVIPEVRLRFFTDPEFNIGSQRSRREIFEQNASADSDFLQHPHFAPYLRYFVQGPDLPEDTMREFCRIINEEILTSGMLLDRLCHFVRSEARRLQLDPADAGDEFYKLALEIGEAQRDARLLRSAARSARR